MARAANSTGTSSVASAHRPQYSACARRVSWSRWSYACLLNCLGVFAFCETRSLAQEWTYRFFGAAVAEHRRTAGADGFADRLPAPRHELPDLEPTTAEVRAWARARGLDVSSGGGSAPKSGPRTTEPTPLTAHSSPAARQGCHSRGSFERGDLVGARAAVERVPCGAQLRPAQLAARLLAAAFPQSESSNECSNGRSVIGGYPQVRPVRPILQKPTSDVLCGTRWYWLKRL